MKAYELALMARHFVEARWRWQALHSAPQRGTGALSGGACDGYGMRRHIWK